MRATAKNSRPRETGASPELVFEKAGFLDIPFIFQLLLEGGIAGSFSDRYLIGAGHFKLFMRITDLVAPWPRWLTWKRTVPRAPALQIVRDGDDDVALVQIAFNTTAFGDPHATLVMLAVAQKQKNKRYGTQIVQALVRDLPELGMMDVYCTKYARAMHRILYNLHFKRDRIMVRGLSRFVLSRHPAADASA